MKKRTKKKSEVRGQRSDASRQGAEAFHYLISYSYNNGFGSCEVKRQKPICNYQDLRGIAALIECENITGVIIINVQPFPIIGSDRTASFQSLEKGGAR